MKTEPRDTDENCLPPPGMTAEEFAIRKRRLKRRWGAMYIFWILLIVAVFESVGWYEGFYVEVQSKRLEELEMISGAFRAPNPTATIKVYTCAIKDEKTGKILSVNPSLCGTDKAKEWRKYEGRPAKMWYFHYSGEANLLYQLEVDGKLISDLATANSRVGEFNERTRVLLWFRFGVPFGFAVLIGVPCYGMYLKAKEKLYKGED